MICILREQKIAISLSQVNRAVHNCNPSWKGLCEVEIQVVDYVVPIIQGSWQMCDDMKKVK